MSLRQLYDSGIRRSGDPSKPWYKESRNGSCPDKRKDKPIQYPYWEKFGCRSNFPTQDLHHRAELAGQCASERMANMRYINPAPNKGHVYAIQLAHGLGRQCLSFSKNNNKLPAWNAKFDRYYNELIQGKPDANTLFDKSLRSYNIDNNTLVQQAVANSAYVSSNESNSSNNNGWTTVTRKTRGGKRSTRKISKPK